MRRARGFALVSAVFLLVVLAALAAVIVSLSTSQHLNAARDLLGSRAYFAARTGIEWGAYQVLQNGGSCASSTALPALGGSAADFSVVVACARYPASGSVDEAGTPVVVYQITATASTGTLGEATYTERQLSAVVSTP